MNFKELLNGDYWLYYLEDGGVGIVKADSSDEAERKVREAYAKHSGNNGEFTEQIGIYEFDGSNWFEDSPDVFEVVSE